MALFFLIKKFKKNLKEQILTKKRKIRRGERCQNYLIGRRMNYKNIYKNEEKIDEEEDEKVKNDKSKKLRIKMSTK